MINKSLDMVTLKRHYKTAMPFDHVLIDDFFLPEIAEALENDFPSYDGDNVIKYKNALENKHTLNRWDLFPSTTYKAFDFLGHQFVSIISWLADRRDIKFDFGLNGGGWHMHGRGGNNNVHLDYNLHPKLGEQRKVNIIVYLTKGWDPEWGGGLELWSHDPETNSPKELIKTIDNIYNRAIIFDTTQHSWHGLPKFINCPEGVVRKSIAGYYTIPAPEGTEQRGRALFAPREEQKNDPSVRDLIDKRANVNTSSDVYRKG